MRDSILQSAIEYAELGFDTLPLAPGTKRAISKDYPNRVPAEMWERAPRDANIGLRCGGDLQFAVIDADDKNAPGTSANIARYLAGLGFDAGDYPLVATPSNGRHCYLTLADTLPGNVRLLAPSIGAGELRFGRGAYIGAPPSVVESNAYTIIAGDLRTLAHIEPRDLLPILANQNTLPEAKHPAISRRAWSLVNGANLDRYHSRSEAEQAIIASLIATGQTFDDVVSLFIAYPCAGKFAELYRAKPKRAIEYLKHSFDSATRWHIAHTSQGRKIADAAMRWALARAWSGRTGTIDRAVFIAHATIAKQTGRIEYQASARTLAELAQVGTMTATRATRRLEDAGRLEKIKQAVIAPSLPLANVYRLKNDDADLLQTDTLSHPNTMRECISTQRDYRLKDDLPQSEKGQTDTLSHSNTMRECISLSLSCDAFWARGLGKSAGQIFEILRRESLTIKELAERTGRHSKTIRRALNRMTRIADGATGEVVSIVHRDGNKWRARNDVDLDYIARCVGTHGKAERQRAQHARERKDFRARVKLQPKGNEPRCAS